MTHYFYTYNYISILFELPSPSDPVLKSILHLICCPSPPPSPPNSSQVPPVQVVQQTTPARTSLPPPIVQATLQATVSRDFPSPVLLHFKRFFRIRKDSEKSMCKGGGKMAKWSLSTYSYLGQHRPPEILTKFQFPPISTWIQDADN